MKQIYHNPKGRSVEIAELPEPALRPGTLLVRTAFSVVSPGTERAAVKLGSESLLATGRARPDLVRRVIDIVRREGVLAAYRKVQARLGELQPLGYSSAGTVVAVGREAGDYFQVGDRVACAGAGHASHAEVVCVPINLAARVPAEVPLNAAAFATLGSIALHGVRQAAPTLGERFAVIGLGVMGLLTVQILRAAGARVIGFDLDPELVKRAIGLGAESGAHGSVEDQVSAAITWSEGVGVDGVIVTAGSKDDAPMVAAAGMCRDRARVVAVGLVPFGLPRDVAYSKELELRISRSYGPGRYDNQFEEKGHEYPLGYVRWTETRNLEAFLHLVAEGKVTPLALVTHQFGVDQAPRAYDLLLDERAPRPLGIIIEYPETAESGVLASSDVARAPVGVVPAPLRPALATDEPIAIGCIGAGSFACSILFPILRRQKGVRLRTVVAAHGVSALRAQREFGFQDIGTDVEAILSDPSIHLVVIATRHDSHADLAARALDAGKHVFVEKPLALNEEQLSRVEAAARTSPGLLMVGYNRRYAPHAAALRQAFRGRGPLVMTYRVNAGPLTPGHWLNDPDIGGGRIVGEACHFIDLMSFLTGDAGIVAVEARRAASGVGPAEDVQALLTFADGSIGHLLYTAGGSIRLGKERLEVHGGGASGLIDDFRSCVINVGRRAIRMGSSAKGHDEEVALAIRVGRGTVSAPVPMRVLVEGARASFAVAGIERPERFARRQMIGSEREGPRESH